MPQYSEWDDPTPFPSIDWDIVIRWAAMLLAWGLAVVTACCLSRPVTWAVDRWWP